ncbi:hypothetical protein CDAR_376641 [Caerostris darwini]|uniref:Maturase n=1 Tax=Caerostris darwini TaxID=1538125 RepID=A0AAV4R9F1_9ARAC|nr:hypothetical protein CDAR_376641 [Caerostris darwini]
MQITFLHFLVAKGYGKVAHLEFQKYGFMEDIGRLRRELGSILLLLAKKHICSEERKVTYLYGSFIGRQTRELGSILLLLAKKHISSGERRVTDLYGSSSLRLATPNSNLGYSAPFGLGIVR